ncbi:RHS repeat domain-containing protein [Streptomyces microflavus]|uniref:RHS repeat domain-containing protein n=1 Tax=Streptomyces microflavus TaxID=1919 RepID=UPI0036540F31
MAAAMGSLGGAVDERRGEARFGPVLGGVSGPAGSGLQVKAQFSQGLSAAGLDRFGLGSGMSLGLPFIDVERGVLVLPSAEHRMDASVESGLRNYKLKDVKLTTRTGTTPVGHAYVLESFKDGSKQYFDQAGDLVAVQDRHDHVTKLMWKSVNNMHRLDSVTGGWGSKLSVRYEGSKVVFVSPKRWGQTKAPETVIELAQGRVRSVTEPSGEKTEVEWRTEGANALVVPAAVVSPTGARTEFGYTELEKRSGGVVAVSKVEVKDAAGGKTIVDPVTVSLDPDGANGGRNYTGCPEYCEDGTDRLENSGDGSFTYRVRFSQENGQEVERTYNALHLQKREVNRVRIGSQSKEVSRTEVSYPGEKADGSPPRVKDAPGDYQMPSRVRVSTVDLSDPSRKKDIEVSTGFDVMGRQTSQVQGGVETSTEFGANSIPVRTETKDTGTGAREVVENTLTGDGKAIAKSVTKAAKDGAGEPGTVSTQEFEYHTGELAGEVAKTTARGDASAKGGDPGAVVTSTRSTVDRDAEGVGRRTNAVTGADGVETVTVSDLASGSTLSERTGDLSETVTGYDVAGRPVEVTAADGTVTTTSHETFRGTDSAAGGSSVTSRRESDGYSTRTVSDELGREVRTESNYRPSGNEGRGRMLPDGQWSQVSGAEFNTSGQQVRTTDAGGRETTIGYDAWGRPAKTTAPDGSLTLSTHDDVEGTTTEQTVPAGADKPMRTSTEQSDDQGNPVRSEVSYGDGTPGAVSETEFDALGKPVSSQQSTSAFTTEHAYTSTGLPASDTLTPKQPGSAEGTQAKYTLDAFGTKTHKTLTKDDESVEGWKTKFDAAGRTEEVSLPGGGGTSTTAYNGVNGLVESVTLPDGSVAHQRNDRAGRTVETWTSPKDDPDTKQDHVRTSYDPVTGGVSAQWIDGDEAGSKITYALYPDGTVRERTDPGGKKTAYTYTDDKRVASVTDHTGAVTRYAYDAKSGRMIQAVQSRGDKELAKVSYRHDASGRLAGIDRGNGAGSTYTYNDAGLPTGEKHTEHGGDVIAEHAYTYTPDRKLATDTATVREMDGTTNSTATAHTYDAEGRLSLTHVTGGDVPGEGILVSRTAYTHDLASNLTEQQTTTRANDGTEKTSTTRYTVDAETSRTTAVTIDGQEKPQSYDTAGRLTQAADGTRHTYNATGQLTETRTLDGTTVTNTYNAAGERATQTTVKDGRENTLTFHPGTETDQNGTTATHLMGSTRETRTITPADGQDPQTAYYLSNRRGDKTHTLDTSGTETSHTAYTDHGIPQDGRDTGNQPLPARTGAITENPYGYAGEYTTPTGHQILGTRWYDPKAAAFTTPDTPTAGMLNPYTYATGDPVNHTDPTGQSPEDAWNWFNDNILSWEGMPYLDVALAGLGIAAATIASAGTMTAPLAIALAAGIATTTAATDQIWTNTTGEGFLPDDVRTGFDVAALAGGITGAGVGGGIAGGVAGRKISQIAKKATERAQQMRKIQEKINFDEYHKNRVLSAAKKEHYTKVPVADILRGEGVDDSVVIEYRLKSRKYDAFSKQDRSMNYVTQLMPHGGAWFAKGGDIKMINGEARRVPWEHMRRFTFPVDRFVIMKHFDSPARVISTRHAEAASNPDSLLDAYKNKGELYFSSSDFHSSN